MQKSANTIGCLLFLLGAFNQWSFKQFSGCHITCLYNVTLSQCYDKLCMEPLLEGLLRSLGGSEANFLEVCFGRIPCGNFHTEATSKKSRPPSGNFRPNPPRSSDQSLLASRSFSSQEAGRKIVLNLFRALSGLSAFPALLASCFGTTLKSSENLGANESL